MASEYFEIIENRGKVGRVNVFHCREGLLRITQLTYLLLFRSSLQELKKYIYNLKKFSKTYWLIVPSKPFLSCGAHIVFGNGDRFGHLLLSTPEHFRS